MFDSLALVISCLALAAGMPHDTAKPAPLPAVATVQVSQADRAPESENLQAELDEPASLDIPKIIETPGEWKKRMVRPCTRVGNRVTC
jgi:hypothetical protein